MKKIFLAALCAVCALTASAQRASSSTSFFSSEKSNESVTVGIRVGGNSSSLGGDQSSFTKSKLGFHAGLSVDVPILESFGINTGLFYSNKGTKDKFGGDKLTADYIEIPVLASYRYHFNENVRLDIDFGPYFAYGIHGSDGVFSSEDDYYNDDYRDYYDDDEDDGVIKRFDAGLAFGAGITVNKFYAGLHYEAGLLDVSNSEYSVKINNLLLTIGLNF